MRRFIFLIGVLVHCLTMCGCSKEDPIPEERDPIYKDLEKRKVEHVKLVDEAYAQLKDLKDKAGKAEPNTIQLRDIQRDIAKYKRQVLENEQWARYYKIRAERRKIVDRLVYRDAFAAKRPWPDPREYSDYQANRRLVEINRNWNVRVPKLQDRLPSSQKEGGNKRKEEKKAAH